MYIQQHRNNLLQDLIDLHLKGAKGCFVCFDNIAKVAVNCILNKFGLVNLCYKKIPVKIHLND